MTGTPEDPLVALFKEIEAQQAEEQREIEALAAEIGHNGGPPMAEPFGINAPWFKHAEPKEVERLAKLHVRIERKRALLKEVTEERKRIMMRCIRRMRRSEGKE